MLSTWPGLFSLFLLAGAAFHAVLYPSRQVVWLLRGTYSQNTPDRKGMQEIVELSQIYFYICILIVFKGRCRCLSIWWLVTSYIDTMYENTGDNLPLINQHFLLSTWIALFGIVWVTLITNLFVCKFIHKQRLKQLAWQLHQIVVKFIKTTLSDILDIVILTMSV